MKSQGPAQAKDHFGFAGGSVVSDLRVRAAPLADPLSGTGCSADRDVLKPALPVTGLVKSLTGCVTASSGRRASDIIFSTPMITDECLSMSGAPYSAAVATWLAASIDIVNAMIPVALIMILSLVATPWNANGTAVER